MIPMRTNTILFVRVLLTGSIFLCTHFLLAAPKVSESGAPSGWSAKQYETVGSQLLKKKQFAESRKYFDAAIRLDPNLWAAYYNRAISYQMQENWPACIKDLDASIRLKPDVFEPRFIRSITYRRVGNYAASLQDLNVLVNTARHLENPGLEVLYLNDRAWVLATAPDASVRNGKSALVDARRACDLSHWKRSDTLDSLAAAYAESGDFNSAIRYQQQAIDLGKSNADEEQQSKDAVLKKDLVAHTPARLKSFAQRIELYKQHHPYRDSPTK